MSDTVVRQINKKKLLTKLTTASTATSASVSVSASSRTKRRNSSDHLMDHSTDDHSAAEDHSDDSSSSETGFFSDMTLSSNMSNRSIISNSDTEEIVTVSDFEHEDDVDDHRDNVHGFIVGDMLPEPHEGFPLMQCGSLEIGEEQKRVVSMMEGLTLNNNNNNNSNNGNQMSTATEHNSNNSNNSNSNSNRTTTEAQQRIAVLSYEQVRRLNDVMDEIVCIHGRGNFPTLEVRLRDLVTVVRTKLEADTTNGGAGMRVRDIRLNGGAASHVLATESQPYNDLDLIFGVELSSGRNYDRVKTAVLSSLYDLLPEGVIRKRISTCSLKEAYVSKMVKVNNDGDRWSLISLGNSRGHKNVELKFVDTMRRQFEFSVDSFQIVLDSLLLFYEYSTLPISENFYPTVVGESVYGDFQEALYHLQKKLISTRHPEEIRGGGLLKYCYLLVKMYRPARPDYIKTLERYMCSRFFIDFPDITQQRAKLENYLWNHFVGPEEESLKYQYLMLLHSVVEESTVCLMGHERRQTLLLIESLAIQIMCQEQHRMLSAAASQQPTTLVYANGIYYAPIIPTSCYPCTCSTWMCSTCPT